MIEENPMPSNRCARRSILVIAGVAAFQIGLAACKSANGRDESATRGLVATNAEDAYLFYADASPDGKVCVVRCSKEEFDAVKAKVQDTSYTQPQAISHLKSNCVRYGSIHKSDFTNLTSAAFRNAVNQEGRLFEVTTNNASYRNLEQSNRIMKNADALCPFPDDHIQIASLGSDDLDQPDGGVTPAPEECSHQNHRQIEEGAWAFPFGGNAWYYIEGYMNYEDADKRCSALFGGCGYRLPQPLEAKLAVFNGMFREDSNPKFAAKLPNSHYWTAAPSGAHDGKYLAYTKFGHIPAAPPQNLFSVACVRDLQYPDIEGQELIWRDDLTSRNWFTVAGNYTFDEATQICGSLFGQDSWMIPEASVFREAIANGVADPGRNSNFELPNRNFWTTTPHGDRIIVMTRFGTSDHTFKNNPAISVVCQRLP